MLHKMSVVDVIRHYQRSIEKCGDDEKRMLHCINKLCRLPITVQHLKETGVGRTVNGLRKYDGQVGEAAKYTVLKWKQMVADEESSEDDGDGAAAEAYQENVGKAYTQVDEEEEPDNECKNSVIRENSMHVHRESHSKSKKDDTHRSHANKVDLKVQKEKLHRNADQNKKKNKDHQKYENLNHIEEKQSHKRKGDSNKTYSIEEKRRKYDSDNVSDDDSESQEMQIDEQLNENNYSEGDSDELEEEDEQEEEKDGSDDNDSDNIGSTSDSSSRLLAPSHKHHSKHHSSSSGAHHNKHHKESHRKHEKHKDKKYSSSEKHSKKGDSDKVNERTSGSSHKEKHSKHKDDKHEHKGSKHKNSSIVSGSNQTGGTGKEYVKHKDSEPQVKDNKKRTKEKTESGEKSSSSSKHQKSSNSKTKESKDKKRKNITPDEEEDDGITSMSGASFAEALGMVDPMIKKKTITSGTSSNSKAHRNTNSKASSTSEKSSSKSKEMKAPKTIPSVNEEPTLLSSAVKLEPLKVDLDATLPEISPNYRPLPHPNMDAFPQRKTKSMSEEDALALAMSQKNQRTRVYSGIRSGKSWSTVPSLFDICVRVLQEHIEAIEYTGGVPYDLLKPILIIATPDQLYQLEHYNDYLIEETDELWEFHCNKSFRNKQREEMETWREMYLRCVEEREAKLKALTSNIQQSIAKSTPVRQTKLAYVDSVVKPPRNVAKQQARYGTASTSTANKGSPLKGHKPGISGISAGSGMSASAAPVAVPPPRGVPPVAKVKPRMAPLMQKTMKLVKSFKR